MERREERKKQDKQGRTNLIRDKRKKKEAG